MLIHFGGHQAAAGLAVELDKLQEFKDKFNQIVKESINEEDLLPEVTIDAKIKFSDITPKFLRILDQFAPFGPENMRPVFLTENVELSNTPRIVGNNHIMAGFKQKNSDKVFDAIGFNMREYLDLFLKKNTKVDIVYTIDKTVRDSRTYPQLRLKDLRLSEKES
jgi:single-stranded-DNA-specific exonuclease